MAPKAAEPKAMAPNAAEPQAAPAAESLPTKKPKSKKPHTSFDEKLYRFGLLKDPPVPKLPAEPFPEAPKKPPPRRTSSDKPVEPSQSSEASASIPAQPKKNKAPPANLAEPSHCDTTPQPTVPSFHEAPQSSAPQPKQAFPSSGPQFPYHQPGSYSMPGSYHHPGYFPSTHQQHGFPGNTQGPPPFYQTSPQGPYVIT